MNDEVTIDIDSYCWQALDDPDFKDNGGEYDLLDVVINNIRNDLTLDYTELYSAVESAVNDFDNNVK